MKVQNVRVVLFDVGGVLVQLSGVATILDWTRHSMSTEDLWRLWLQSPSVRAFETGKMAASEFAANMIQELRIAIEPQLFLESFIGWPTGLFPNALEMIARIPRRYTRALLSNSNALHWPRVMGEMGLGPAFEHHFVSHLIGKIKPDVEAFHHVVESLECRPSEVLFFDDNLINVEAAHQVGMHARVVRGVAEAERALLELGILNAEQA